MKLELLEILRCPKSNQLLSFVQKENTTQDLDSGFLVSQDNNYKYSVESGIPRFVLENNYADSFGMQWNLYAKTQLDSHTGLNISANRFWKATGWSPNELKNKWVLDVGCGSGRFAEIALNAGAKVVALDYSSAVDACKKNFLNHPNLYVVQGDIYELPFDLDTFSFVYSLGVLQHTPDPKSAFMALPLVLKKEGKICVDYYEKSLKSMLLPKYWLRPITKRIPNQKLFSFLKKTTPFLLYCSVLISKLPLFGNTLKRVVPVANYHGILPLNTQQHLEWSLLDTFDWLSPEHDHPQTSVTIRQWMNDANIRDIEILKAGHLVSRGKK
jgi:SAM-dependent methyltransferase